MLERERGFSLLEILIATAISSILLMGAARFLPALQRGVLEQARAQTVDDDIWQRTLAIARHLQRAGYCASRRCEGEAVRLGPGCALIRWDTRQTNTGAEKAIENADVTGFRLRDGALETLRGAVSCEGKGWEKMTEPGRLRIEAFSVSRQQIAGFAPVFTVMLSARGRGRGASPVQASFSVTAYNL